MIYKGVSKLSVLEDEITSFAKENGIRTFIELG